MSDEWGGENPFIENNESNKTIKGGSSVSQEDLKKISDDKDLNVSECKLGEETNKNRCATDTLAAHLSNIVLVDSKKTGNLDKDYSAAVIKTNKENNCKGQDCTSETLAIFNNKDKINDKVLEQNRDKFVGTGPAGDNKSDREEWLSNAHIDDNIMTHYKNAWEKKGIKFYHIPFHMRGFMKDEHQATDSEKEHQEFPTDLAKLSDTFYDDVIKGGYKYFGCILNIDTYDNGGKHWVALFVDIPNKTFEYFDSVGHPPFPDVIEWMEKCKANIPDPGWKIAEFNNYQHQRENWDCGLFSCFYIIKRVNGTPYPAFHTKSELDDNLMKDLRHRFFSLKKF